MLIGGQTPILSNQQLHEMGFSMIVHGTTLIKRVAKSLQIILADLYHDRLDCNPDEFVPLLEFMSLTGAETWQQFEESIKQDNNG
jgi:2-methylisocitrate lyase-like PEP mutase family enzyme